VFSRARRIRFERVEIPWALQADISRATQVAAAWGLAMAPRAASPSYCFMTRAFVPPGYSDYRRVSMMDGNDFVWDERTGGGWIWIWRGIILRIRRQEKGKGGHIS